MLLPATRKNIHLTYCLNIHPGEGWAENLAAIRTHTLAVRRALGVTDGFGLGLRLSWQAAQELGQPVALAEFARFLHDEGLYVFTVNGFPYGRFHGTRVKEQVYEPDWRTPERVAYTARLARILTALLTEAEAETSLVETEGGCGSISTLPGSYRAWIQSENDRLDVLRGLARAVLDLAKLLAATGYPVRLALEPEPDCLWDDTEGILGLFRELRTGPLTPRLAKELGVPSTALAKAWEEHLAVCVDTCHFAVNFAAVATALEQFRAARIRVAKVQVSTALAAKLPAAGGANPAQLFAPFADEVYLHQTRLRQPSGKIACYPDLPAALTELAATPAAAKGPGARGTARADRAVGELRTHFHVPLYWEGGGDLRSTRSELDPRFFELLRGGITPHIELETYTFAVLPAEMRARGVVASLVDEYGWFLARWEDAVNAERLQAVKPGDVARAEDAEDEEEVDVAPDGDADGEENSLVDELGEEPAGDEM